MDCGLKWSDKNEQQKKMKTNKIYSLFSQPGVMLSTAAAAQIIIKIIIIVMSIKLSRDEVHEKKSTRNNQRSESGKH